MLRIHKKIYKDLVDHALKDAPIEACGYLGETDGLIDAILPMKNFDHSSEHLSLDPVEQSEKIKELRRIGKKAAAVYHSHPVTLAHPSEEDIRLAVDPVLSYVIVSLAGKAPVVKSFQILKTIPVEEPIEIVTNTAGGN